MDVFAEFDLKVDGSTKTVYLRQPDQCGAPCSSLSKVRSYSSNCVFLASIPLCIHPDLSPARADVPSHRCYLEFCTADDAKTVDTTSKHV